MIIQHNMAAIYTNMQLGIAHNNKMKYAEKLSTGYKINRAADNAAGLVISETMRAQIRGLDKSQENIQDGISYCNVADGALSQVQSILDRVKELAVQSANDSYTDQDRSQMDEEAQQLKKEMTDIFENTSFNTINIWQGAYIPDAGGECTDFSLYNVQDANGSYYGGITYMNHRYSWEDLGITNWDASTRTFTSTDTFKIDANILHNNGLNSANDSSSSNDDYISDGNSGATFSIHTTKDSRAIDIEKSYDWKANNNGIYIDGVLTNGTVPGAGNTTWAAMGLTAGQDVNGGTYSFNYYGMNVSFDVPDEGASWTSFLQSFNNPLADINWHSTYSTKVSKEVADISNTTSKILIDNSNKDYISADSNPYRIYADSDGIWMENTANATEALTKTGTDATLIRWEDLSNMQGYDINSWGIDTGGTSATNVNSTTNEDGGDTYVTLNSNAVYLYKNILLGGNSNFSFDLKLLGQASRGAIISDINNSYYNNLGIISPSTVSSYTSGSADFPSSPSSANLAFLTQRDLLKRTFSNDYESYANGVLSRDLGTGNYKMTLTGISDPSYTYELDSTESSLNFENRISNDIKTKMENLYNPVKAASGDISKLSDTSDPATLLGLGTYTLTFQHGLDNVSLQLDLSQMKYGDIISSSDYGILGETPDSGDFSTRVSSYVGNKVNDFLASTFNISGNGTTYQNLALQEKSVLEDVAVNVPVVDGFDLSLMIQGGANSYEGIPLKYEYLRLGSLGIKTLDVANRDSANTAIKSVEGAIDKVSQQRSLFGAYTNRLEHASNISGNSEENLQNAESQIRDTDMAKELVEYHKHNILEQVGQSILAHANQSTQSVLNLFQ